NTGRQRPSAVTVCHCTDTTSNQQGDGSMRHLSVRKKRVASLLGAGALLIGGVGAPALLAAAPASATTCATGTACTVAGTATLGIGTLSVTTPDTFTWAGT